LIVLLLCANIQSPDLSGFALIPVAALGTLDTPSMTVREYYRGVEIVAAQQADLTWLVWAGDLQVASPCPTAADALSEAKIHVDQGKVRPPDIG